jgi:V/A-type H+-transporting ATPase subunit I
MIVTMKKVSLLCLAADRERTLDALCDLGVMHVTPAQPPAGPELDALRKQRAEAEKALAVLARFSDGQPAAGRKPPPAADLAPTVLSESRRLADMEARISELEAERTAIAPFGAFDPAAARRLSQAGVSIRLFVAPSLKGMEPPAGFTMQPLGQTASGQAFALVGRGQPVFDGAREVQIPERGIQEVERLIGDARRSAEESRAALRRLAAGEAELRRLSESLAEQTLFAEARAGMGADRGICWLQGFCPEPRLAELEEAARAKGWALLARDPEQGDSVPTLIRIPRWARPIQSVFDLTKILPGYHEADVSASFMLFLSLFFALIIGDAGYGIVFLALTLWARRKLRTAPPEPFHLLTVMSAATIVWGTLCGTWFGVCSKALPFQPMQEIAAWLSSNDNMTWLCLLIGSIHLTVAHAWNVVRFINTPQALAQFGWILMTWALFLVARLMLLGQQCPPALLIGLFGAGIVLILLFMTPVRKLKSEWINHAMLPLSLMSGFGDILSYMRLFALSMAGVQLAGSFNSIALSMGAGSVAGSIGMALILFFGHALNIVLGAMSVLVHGIRLNALEFSMHMGLEWSGQPYRPFARRGRDAVPAK